MTVDARNDEILHDEVRYDLDGRVATLTLNRPAQRNAVSPELTRAMDAALQRQRMGELPEGVIRTVKRVR